MKLEGPEGRCLVLGHHVVLGIWGAFGYDHVGKQRPVCSRTLPASWPLFNPGFGQGFLLTECEVWEMDQSSAEATLTLWVTPLRQAISQGRQALAPSPCSWQEGPPL